MCKSQQYGEELTEGDGGKLHEGWVLPVYGSGNVNFPSSEKATRARMLNTHESSLGVTNDRASTGAGETDSLEALGTGSDLVFDFLTLSEQHGQ